MVSLAVKGKFGKTSKSLKILWNWLSTKEKQLSSKENFQAFFHLVALILGQNSINYGP